jgi:hypothetical protein
MTDVLSLYALLRERARLIAARLPPPAFYREQAVAVGVSCDLFDLSPLVVDLRRDACLRLEDDFGHGMRHAVKVALDAGALTHIEGRAAGYGGGDLARRISIAHCAGLLHDIVRKQANHAEQGASHARRLLAAHPLSVEEIEDICLAIRNHEAFRPTAAVNTREGALVSDCLYDADKFRWGPDNFTDTLWDMLAFTRPSLPEFLRHYPRGMERIAGISSTFRTPSGKKYGPGFIDLGLAIGRELHGVIVSEFAS